MTKDALMDPTARFLIAKGHSGAELSLDTVLKTQCNSLNSGCNENENQDYVSEVNTNNNHLSHSEQLELKVKSQEEQLRVAEASRKKMIAKQVRDMMSFTKDLNSLKTSKFKSEQICDNLQKELSETKDVYDSKVKEHKHFEESALEKKKKMEEIQMKLEAEISNLKNECQRNTEEIVRQQNVILELEKKEKDICNSRDTFQSSYLEEHNNHNCLKEQLESRLKVSSDEVKAYNKRCKENEKILALYENSIQSHLEKIKKLENECRELNSKIEQKEMEKKLTEEQVDCLSDGLKNLQKQLKDVELLYTELKLKYAQDVVQEKTSNEEIIEKYLHSPHDSEHEVLAAYDREYRVLLDRIDQLQSELEKKEPVLSAYHKEFKVMLNKVDELESDLQKKNNLIHYMDAERMLFEDKLSHLHFNCDIRFTDSHRLVYSSAIEDSAQMNSLTDSVFDKWLQIDMSRHTTGSSGSEEFHSAVDYLESEDKWSDSE